MIELFINLALGILLIVFGFLVVKYPMWILAYNVLPKLERDKMDIRPYALFMRKQMVAMGSIMIIGALVFFFMGFRGWSCILLMITLFSAAGIQIKWGCTLRGTIIQYSNMQKWIYRIAIAIVIIVFGGIFYIGSPAKIEVKENNLIIHGAYGLNIPLNLIKEVKITDHLPTITFRANGLGFWKYNKGYFLSKEEGRVKLFLHSCKGPYLVIKSSETLSIIINRDSSKEIDDLYDALNNNR